MLGIYFFICAGLSLTLYPLYSRWRYKKHYSKYIQDTYKNQFGGDCSLEFGAETIVTKDATGETKLNISEVEAINEIRDFYFIKMNSGLSLIIPKAKADNLQYIKNEIKSLVEKRGIQHHVEMDWKWR